MPARRSGSGSSNAEKRKVERQIRGGNPSDGLQQGPLGGDTKDYELQICCNAKSSREEQRQSCAHAATRERPPGTINGIGARTSPERRKPFIDIHIPHLKVKSLESGEAHWTEGGRGLSWTGAPSASAAGCLTGAPKGALEGVC